MDVCNFRLRDFVPGAFFFSALCLPPLGRRHKAPCPERWGRVSLKVGSLLGGKYEVIRSLVSGGMGAIYEARSLAPGADRVAVKQLLQHLLEGEQAELFRSKFRSEVEFLGQLRHPGIPRLLDSLEDNGTFYIVMEFIAGRNLEQELEERAQLANQQASATQVINDACQLLEILDHLHSQSPPLLHRDIKPANLIREHPSGRIKLVDFGMARLLSEGPMQTQTQLGTLGYSPLEQLQGRAEQRSDLYAVGATMHHLLTGHPPKALDIPPLGRLRSDLDPALAALVDQACASEPGHRFPSARAMKAALSALASGSAPRLRLEALPVKEAAPWESDEPAWSPPRPAPAAAGSGSFRQPPPVPSILTSGSSFATASVGSHPVAARPQEGAAPSQLQQRLGLPPALDSELLRLPDPPEPAEQPAAPAVASTRRSPVEFPPLPSLDMPVARPHRPSRNPAWRPQSQLGALLGLAFLAFVLGWGLGHRPAPRSTVSPGTVAEVVAPSASDSPESPAAVAPVSETPVAVVPVTPSPIASSEPAPLQNPAMPRRFLPALNQAYRPVSVRPAQPRPVAGRRSSSRPRPRPVDDEPAQAYSLERKTYPTAPSAETASSAGDPVDGVAVAEDQVGLRSAGGGLKLTLGPDWLRVKKPVNGSSLSTRFYRRRSGLGNYKLTIEGRPIPNGYIASYLNSFRSDHMYSWHVRNHGGFDSGYQQGTRSKVSYELFKASGPRNNGSGWLIKFEANGSGLVPDVVLGEFDEALDRIQVF